MLFKEPGQEISVVDDILKIPKYSALILNQTSSSDKWNECVTQHVGDPFLIEYVIYK